MNEKIDWDERAKELYRQETKIGTNVVRATDHWVLRLMLKLGQEMADARAEEIARMLDKPTDRPWEELPHDYALRAAARIARSTIQKPKTREERLEEALREIANSDFDTFDHWQRQARMRDAARRALEENQ